MPLRLFIGSGGCALLGALIYLLGQLAPPAVQSAQQLLGERWYKLEFEDQRVGYLHTRARRDRAGRWLFTSELRFALIHGDPVTMVDELVFDANPPHRLRLAQHRNKQRDTEETIAIARTTDGYDATISFTGNAGSNHSRELDWAYSLDDYVSFETWLRLEAPRVGAVKPVPTLDFTRQDIITRKFRIIDHNATGYRVENPAPFDYTSIQLDRNYAPVTLEMSGLFTLKRSSREQALGPRSALQSASYYIPADRPLSDHTRIEHMVLSVHSNDETAVFEPNSWSDLEPQGNDWILTLNANPLAALEPHSDSLEETHEFPISSRRIVRLARDAVGNLVDTADRVAALNSYVHRYLAYQPGAPSQPVLALLDRRIGDCTEFADLFTTLARSLKIPARTVFGLAYDNSGSPAFAFHAWNEVSVDGVWQSVDPTWNQLRVDATHIPLPSNQTVALQLLTGALDLRFSVRQVDYFATGAD
ncbi:MAG: transglutaminase-like domain-containing protein [Gammaproteobacteria bacterium]|nr:transglutaminase-like domain-containing protein [Gammaproteobacteria bacterium]